MKSNPSTKKSRIEKKENHLLTKIFLISILLIITTTQKTEAIITDGLIHYYSFEETQNKNIDRIVNGGNNLTRIGGEARVNGIIDKCIKYTSDYTFNSTMNNLPQGNKSRTITFWMNISSSGNPGEQQFILGYGSVDTNKLFSLGLFSSSENRNLTLWGYGNDYVSNETILNNTWYFVAVTYNSSDLIMYINNVTRFNNKTIDFNTSGTYLGVGGPMGYYLSDGLIDEVGIWNRSLESNEINEMYHNGRGLRYECLNFTDTKPIVKIVPETMNKAFDLGKIVGNCSVKEALCGNNISYKWYLNGIVNTTIQNVTEYVLETGQNWTLECQIYDNFSYSLKENASIIVKSIYLNVTVNENTTIEVKDKNNITQKPNTTRIDLDLSNWEKNNYVYITFGNNQSYVFLNDWTEKNITLEIAEGTNARTVKVTENNVGVEEATITIEKSNGTEWKTIGRYLTGGLGEAYIKFEEGTYKLTANKTGYNGNSIITVMNPSVTTTEVIRITKEGYKEEDGIYTDCPFIISNDTICTIYYTSSTHGRNVTINRTDITTGNKITNDVLNANEKIIDVFQINSVNYEANITVIKEGSEYGKARYLWYQRMYNETIINLNETKGNVTLTTPTQSAVSENRKNTITFNAIMLLALIIIIGSLNAYMKGLGWIMGAFIMFILAGKYTWIWMIPATMITIYIIYKGIIDL